MLVISPDRFLNDPLTTSSASIDKPSADFAPRACNWSFAWICASVPGLASAYFTESPLNRLNSVLLPVCTTSFLAPTSSVIVPVAASTVLTIPPTPRAFQSACCAACICAIALDFIRITRSALKLAVPSTALPVTSTRSPTAMSLNCPGVAVFRSVLPTPSCSTFAPLATLTVTACPVSVAIVKLLPAMVFTVPSLETGAAAAAAAGACACAAIPAHVPHAMEKTTPMRNAILSNPDLFPVAICILI